MANLGNTIVNGVLRALNGLYVNTINGVTVGNSPKFTDTNTTYSFATGDSNGQIKVTPSGGSAQNISVKGLGSAAYTASTAYATSGHAHTASLAADTGTSAITLAHGGKYKLTAGNSSVIFTMPSDNNTTYSANNGVGLSGTTFYNSGVRSIATGSANGTISVNTNGTAADVAVKGLGSAAYTASTAYAASSHTHTMNQISWPPGQNLTCSATANNQEWSVDLNTGTYTGGYFHVWSSKNSKSILSCYNDDCSVSIPSGNLTVAGTSTFNNLITLYRESTTANNYPAGIKFKVKDTTTGKTYDSGHIYAYQDHGSETYGVNFVLSGGGGLFIGSGESPDSHYSAKGASYTGEDTFLTADGVVNIQANGNSIGNRLGLQVTTAGALVPIKADAGANNTGSIGTSGLKWANGYFTNINGVAVGDSPKFTDTNTWRGIQNNLTSNATDQSLSAAQGKALANGSARDNTKVAKSGDTMTGQLTLAGSDLKLSTTGSSSDDSSDIAWFYGNGQEKARLWTANDYTAESGLNFRLYKKDGTSLFSGTIPLRNTWRGIQNNLTSDSTTDSLSAAQGKALKTLVDGKAASGHTHTLTIATDSGTNQLTMAANTKYKITAGGSSYIFTTPPNSTSSDVNVTQTATTTDANYEILFSATADNTTRTEGARKVDKLRFNPSKGSLMVGKGTSATGTYSHAEGEDTLASNYTSHAEGFMTSATGEQSHAEGSFTSASGVTTHAEGWRTLASGDDSHAEGYYTSATGERSHAEGSSTRASGYASHAEGVNTVASSQYDHAEGNETKATGSSSHAEGARTTACGFQSHAEGASTNAFGDNSHAGGAYTTAFGEKSFAHGSGVIARRKNQFTVGSNYSKFSSTSIGGSADGYVFSICGDGETYSSDTSIGNTVSTIDSCSGEVLNTATVTIYLVPGAMYYLNCSAYTISNGTVYGQTIAAITTATLATGTPKKTNMGQDTAPATINVAANNVLTIKNGATTRCTQFHLMRVL